MRKYNKDVVVTWSKTLCPICNEPTGKKSKCYDLQIAKETPDNQKMVNGGKQGLLPIYRPNCVFRQDNIWEVSLNYDVHLLLLETIGEIEGIDQIEPSSRYKIKLVIADSFNELTVQQNVNHAIKKLFKELQVTELNRLSQGEPDDVTGIKLPNGQTFVVSNELEKKAVEQLGSELPNSEILKKKKEN